MHQRVTALKTDQNVWTPEALLEAWHHSLQEKDRSAGTVKKYTRAVARFLTWYSREEHAPLTLSTLTPIALIGYRNELQHAQHKSISTINLQVSALRGSPSSSVLSSGIGKKVFTPIRSSSGSPNGDIGDSISLHERCGRA